MKIILDDNPTRQNIITLLKKNGGMGIYELSKKIGITPMGIRQHLLSLEKKGIVSYKPKKHGIGRPGFIYRLTESADSMFIKSYDRFALDLLREVKKNEGDDKVHKIFTWRKDSLLKRRKESLSNMNDIDEKMHGLKNLMENEGYLIDIEKENDKYLLKLYNCPISRISAEFNDACALELQLYKDLLDRNITMLQCMGQGSSACVFLIPTA